MDRTELVRKLVKGKKYRITYRLDSQRRDRAGVATYLGLNQNFHELDFSGRPEFGTTSIDIEVIKKVELVPDNTQCYMDAKV